MKAKTTMQPKTSATAIIIQILSFADFPTVAVSEMVEIGPDVILT